MKKKMVFLLAIVMVVVLAVPVEAVGEMIMVDVWSERNIEVRIGEYFAERFDILNEQSDGTCDSALEAVFEDEEKHLAVMQNLGFDIDAYNIEVVEVNVEPNYAVATVVETVAFHSDGIVTETVEHTIMVYTDEMGKIVVGSDAYAENTTGFASCSYVEATDGSYETMAVSGSRNCIVYVASGEVGYVEGSNNDTKYGDWIGMPNQPWCASFVSWCANQADIPTSIVKYTASSGTMRNFFNNLGKLYEPEDITPRAGDIFFQGTSFSSVSHVGIVESLSGSTLTVIDGNSGNQVRRRSISLTASDLVAIARPGYTSSGHASQSAWSTNATYHWKICKYCDKTTEAKTSHTFKVSGEGYTCSVCGYFTYSTVITNYEEEA